MSIPSGEEQLRRSLEAYAIGRLEAFRVNLEFFLEDIGQIQPRAIPERFAGILMDAENLLIDVRSVLTRSETTPEVTDGMVDAAMEAMVWEGSAVPVEEQPGVMRAVLEKAFSTKENKTILL